jgi:hypothetical protein
MILLPRWNSVAKCHDINITPNNYFPNNYSLNKYRLNKYRLNKYRLNMYPADIVIIAQYTCAKLHILNDTPTRQHYNA